MSKRFRSYIVPALLAVSSISLVTCSGSKEMVREPDRSSQQQSINQESVLNRFIYEKRDTLKQLSLRSRQPEQDRVSGRVDVDSLLAEMTLKEKIGQLFITFASGYFRNEDSEVYRDLARMVTEYQVGGIMFSSGNVYGQAVLTNKLQRISKMPLWITQDMEYGPAMRVNRTTRFTPAMGITATGNPEYAYWAGRITAREAKALGVHQIFAPVLDVNNNPDNPVINVRSFSGDPETVAHYGNAFIRGVQSEGVVATAKHFPGHGDTDVDSHLSLPVIDADYSRLDSMELVPFRAAIDSGISSVMSAHIAFPKLGSNGGSIPGTLDRRILNRILIDSLNFKGVVVTDGLEMSGITSQYSPGEAVIKALEAGADLMLLSPDEMTAINEIEQRVAGGQLSEQRIDRSVRKILSWKKEHGLFREREVPIDELDRNINLRSHELLADEIARKSVTVVKNGSDILPIRASEYPKVTVISVADDESGRTGSYFGSLFKEYHPDVRFHVYDRRSSEAEKQKILNDVQVSDLVVLGSFIYVQSHKSIQLSQEQVTFLKQITESDTKSVLVAFGNPYIIRELPETDAHMLAWASNGNQVRNTVPALFGGSHIQGRLPIQIPGMYPMGHGIDIPQTAIRYDEPETVGFSADSLRRIEQIMRQATFDSTFPGGVVTVLKDGVIAYQEGFGYHTYDKLEAVQSNSVYDLASLTKVVATTTAIMKLVDEGTLSLDDRVGQFIPEYREGAKQQVTIRQLLLHRSGLPPFRVYVDSLHSRDAIVSAVKKEPLVNPPDEAYVYSDLGFILLGEIVHNVTGQRLDRYLRTAFYYPMGMSSTFFNPSRLGYWMRKRIPPTEIDTVYRDQKIHAAVNDERAYYMNGIAGHAGLFSSGYDLSVYAQMLLNKGTYAGRRYLSESTVTKFTSYRSEPGNRALGFDRKSPGFSTAGRLASEDTFGHLGFTGTSLWIDPQRNLAIILLTNRTFPHRSYGKDISRIRAEIADAVISSLEHD